MEKINHGLNAFSVLNDIKTAFGGQFLASFRN